MYHVFFVSGKCSRSVVSVCRSSLSRVKVVGPSGVPAEPDCAREKRLQGENDSLRIFYSNRTEVC